MAYRTYINGHEWLGNNVLYDEIYTELKNQGCPFDEDGCVEDFEIKDLDGLVKACEKVVVKMVEKDKRIADFSETIFQCVEAGRDVTSRLIELHNYAYIFIGVQLLKDIGEFYKQWEYYYTRTDGNKLEMHYRLRGDGKCLFSAY